MSLLRFNQAELQAWADYSGDYNPIHFDEGIAEAAIGQSGVVMHGMLAMMPLKSSHSAMTWADDGWLQWSAMLRQAMPLHADYRLESRVVDPNRQIRFKLSKADDAQTMISGHCAVVDFNPTPYEKYRRLEVPPEEVRRELEGFGSRFPAAHAAWIAIDAMMFSRYLRHHADEVFHEVAAKYVGTDTPGLPSPENIVTMQTHHHDIFRGTLLQRLDFDKISSFEYGYCKTDEILTRDSVFLMVEIPVWINGNLEQVVQIGLMARTIRPATTQGAMYE
jgi:hypothetical protein